jgi:UDP-N-acetylmuramoylalanine--D-glutamate ligase
MDFLNDKRVLVLGLGESGLACARFAAAQGARLRVADSRAAPPQLAALQQICPDADVRLGTFETSLLDDVARIAVSPGLSPHHGAMPALLAAAVERGIPIEGEPDWFSLALAELKQNRGYAPKLIAITGTNGKTTVTMLAQHLAQGAGVSALACGNVSPAMLDALSDALAADSLPQLWVVELSSFQLHYSRHLQADAATVLNLTQDHQDWHASMAEYGADKARIFGAVTTRVLNRDDPVVNGMRPPPPVLPKGAKRRDMPAPIPVVSFGIHAPTAPGDWGIANDGALRWLVRAQPASEPGEPVSLQRLMPADALRIRGSHNQANALAALALLTAAGLPLGALLRGLRDYTGEPHRCEVVASIEGVDYIDDSKGTNVGATLAAIIGLAEGRRCIHLIAGGLGKGQDFAPLAQAVSQTVKTVLLIGLDAPAIRAALVDSGAELIDCASLPDAVRAGSERAAIGDIVLMSPACASMDMFRNYLHRSEVFVASVHALMAERGIGVAA